MKFFSSRFSRRGSQAANGDRTLLITTHSDQDADVIVDDDNDDDDDDDDDDEEDDGDVSKGPGDDAECQRQYGAMQARRTTRDVYTVSTDDIRTDVTKEYTVEVETVDNKRRRKKKTLRKRVRKRMWRVMRSSWKYLRRGMAGYAPGLSAMFTWTVNFNQAASAMTRKTRRV